MERQKTQPILSSDEFEMILTENKAYEIVLSGGGMGSEDYTGLANIPLFDSIEEVDGTRVYDDKQQQQIQLMQQQQQQQQQQLPAVIQGGQGRSIDTPAQLVMGVKDEVYDGTQYALQQQQQTGSSYLVYDDDQFSLTPPENLQAVPYSAVHNINTTEYTQGTNMMRYDQKIEVMENVPRNQLENFDKTQLNVNNLNNLNNTGAGFELQEKPFSPATVETTDLIADLMERNEKTELKFGHEMKCVLGAAPDHETLPRAYSINATTLNDWDGDHNFTLHVPHQNKSKNKWAYSLKAHHIYVTPYWSMEVGLAITDWTTVSNASIRVVAVYQDPQHRTSPVYRCYNCKKTDKDSGEELLDYLIQVTNSGAVHSILGERPTGRQVVTVPLTRPHLGEEHMTLLIKCTCMQSCIGGPNRRPFVLLFSLMVDGVERGRRVLPIKCCKGITRDMRKDESDADAAAELANSTAVSTINNSSAPTTNTTTTTEVDNTAIALVNGTAFTSPKRQSSQKASGSGVTSGSKRKAGGKQFKNQIGSSISLSSDSENEKIVCKKTRLHNKFGFNVSDIAAEGYNSYIHVKIPAVFKENVQEYVLGLIAVDRIKKESPQEYNKHMKL